MPIALARFFINLCTDRGDLVLDPFGGSNTTGAAAEELGRRWLSIEANQPYAAAGRGRFPELAALVPLKDVSQPVQTLPLSGDVQHSIVTEHSHG